MSLLDRVTKTAPPQPYRMYLYAMEKFGKTSWAAFAPKPIFLLTQGETGLLDLIDYGQVPETAHLPPSAENPNGFQSWPELQDAVHAILTEGHDYETLVIDTANGAERMLAQHVLEHDFYGKRTGKGSYSDYGKGDQACVTYWTEFLRQLDAIRTRRRMNVILLAHTQIKTVNNPEGDDYDQLRPEGINKLWPLTHKWASVIAAGTFKLVVKDDKVKEGKERILRLRNSVAVVAGNRYGLPEEIPCGNDPRAAYGFFSRAMAQARAKGPTPLPNKDEFKSLLDRKGMSWARLLKWIDQSQGTSYTADKAAYEQVAPNVLLDFAAQLRAMPDKSPPTAHEASAPSQTAPSSPPDTNPEPPAEPAAVPDHLADAY